MSQKQRNMTQSVQHFEAHEVTCRLIDPKMGIQYYFLLKSSLKRETPSWDGVSLLSNKPIFIITYMLLNEV